MPESYHEPAESAGVESAEPTPLRRSRPIAPKPNKQPAKEHGPFFPLLNRFFEEGHAAILPHGEAMVWFAFLKHLNKVSGNSFPSPATLAGYLGKSERQIRRDIASLEKKGYISTPPEEKGGVTANGMPKVAHRKLLLPKLNHDMDVIVNHDMDANPTMTSEAVNHDIQPQSTMTPAMSGEQNGQTEQHQQKNSVAGDVVEELVKYGVASPVANGLAGKYPHEKIRRHIAETLLRNEQQKDVKSVPAMVVKAITENWDTPLMDQRDKEYRTAIGHDQNYLRDKKRRMQGMVPAAIDAVIQIRLNNAGAAETAKLYASAVARLKQECRELPPPEAPDNLKDPSDARELVEMYERYDEIHNMPAPKPRPAAPSKPKIDPQAEKARQIALLDAA